MAGAMRDDPFHWDWRRVAQELCSQDRPWLPSQSSQYPPLDLLRARLEENEIPGELLLTWDSALPFSDLFNDLGIKKSVHKGNLVKTIRFLRKHSPGYQQWKNQDDALAPDFTLDPDENPALLARPA